MHEQLTKLSILNTERHIIVDPKIVLNTFTTQNKTKDLERKKLY